MVKMPKQSLISKTSYFLSFCKMLNDIADTGKKTLTNWLKRILHTFYWYFPDVMIKKTILKYILF